MEEENTEYKAIEGREETSENSLQQDTEYGAISSADFASAQKESEANDSWDIQQRDLEMGNKIGSGSKRLLRL